MRNAKYLFTTKYCFTSHAGYIEPIKYYYDFDKGIFLEVNPLIDDDTQVSAKDIYKIFNGDMPFSAVTHCGNDIEELIKSSVLKEEL